MSRQVTALRIRKPHFTITVYDSMLKVDLKGSLKNDIEEAFENTPLLAETIGSILEIFVPLHVHLSDIDSVSADKKGKVSIKLPRHRDLAIPLEPKEAKRLVDKLNELIPRAKEKELKRVMKEKRLRRIKEADYELDRERMVLPPGGAQFPVPYPHGVLEEEKEAEKETEKEQER
jgi:hypothetical protein